VASRTDTTLKPDAGQTSEQVRDVRARAWSYVFECFNRRNGQEGGPATAPDDGTKVKEDSANAIIPKRS
jgi:hypothetical protein